MSIKTLNEVQRVAETQLDRLLLRVLSILKINAIKQPMQPEKVEDALMHALNQGSIVFQSGYFIPNNIEVFLHPDDIRFFKRFWSMFLEGINETLAAHIKDHHKTSKNCGEKIILSFIEDDNIVSGHVRCEATLIDRGEQNG